MTASRRPFAVLSRWWLPALLGLVLVPQPAFSQAVQEAAKPAQAKKAQAKAKAKPALIEPTYKNVPYGDHERQVLDLYQAKSDQPTPLVVYIHGGGWLGGDKGRVGTVNVPKLLENGISVAAINYRYVSQADEAGIKPPVKWPLEDAARAVQFLRSKAGEWNFDRTKVGANGGSAGACSSLWLALHDDMAKPDSEDPVARESTRLACAAVVGAQTAFDPQALREWMPNITYGGHAFGFLKAGDRPAQFEALLENREEVLPWIREYSPIDLATADDPPLFLDYPSQDRPPVIGEEQKDATHSAIYGLKLQEKLQSAGAAEVILAYPGHKNPQYADSTDFLIDRLKGDH